jgi:hypothetical protein
LKFRPLTNPGYLDTAHGKAEDDEAVISAWRDLFGLMSIMSNHQSCASLFCAVFFWAAIVDDMPQFPGSHSSSDGTRCPDPEAVAMLSGLSSPLAGRAGPSVKLH